MERKKLETVCIDNTSGSFSEAIKWGGKAEAINRVKIDLFGCF